MGESITGVRFTDQAALELSKLQGSEEYKAFLPYIAVSVHYRSVQVTQIDLKNFLSNAACHLAVIWGYYPCTLSWSQVSATHLKIRHA